MFLFREVGLTWPCQSNKCLIWLTKQINTFTSNQSYLVKYLVQKKPEDSTVKCLWWSLIFIKSQVKLATAGAHIFLECFQFSQSIILYNTCECLLLTIRCFPRIVDKKKEEYIEWQGITTSGRKNGN